MRKHLRLSPAFIVAVLALFVALAGTAGAAVTAVVPLAKRALVADNAKKLNGLTANRIATAAARAGAQTPGPSSTAAGLISVKTKTVRVAAQSYEQFTVDCDLGQKAIGGGFSSDGAVVILDSYPAGDSTWRVFYVNTNLAKEAHLNLYVTCIR